MFSWSDSRSSSDCHVRLSVVGGAWTITGFSDCQSIRKGLSVVGGIGAWTITGFSDCQSIRKGLSVVGGIGAGAILCSLAAVGEGRVCG